MLIVLKNGNAIRADGHTNIVFENTTVTTEIPGKPIPSLSFLVNRQPYKVLATDVKRIEP